MVHSEAPKIALYVPALQLRGTEAPASEYVLTGTLMHGEFKKLMLVGKGEYLPASQGAHEREVGVLSEK